MQTPENYHSRLLYISISISIFFYTVLLFIFKLLIGWSIVNLMLL